jgi:hypothetical protein
VGMFSNKPVNMFNEGGWGVGVPGVFQVSQWPVPSARLWISTACAKPVCITYKQCAASACQMTDS